MSILLNYKGIAKQKKEEKWQWSKTHDEEYKERTVNSTSPLIPASNSLSTL